MGTSLLIMVREGFEASLIVAIVFAYLRRIGRLDLGRAVWAGVAAAAAVSIAVGVVLHMTIGDFTGAARLRSFAVISVAAAVVLTWMVFWMRRQSRAIKGDLEHRVDDALHGAHVMRALTLVAFLAVLREGIETALFLIAASTTSTAGQVVVGGLIGLAIAIALGVMVYVGGRRLPMRTFFRVTGLIVIVFAAGLCAKTVMFLQQANDLGTINNAVYDVTGVDALTQSTQFGRFLASLFGWDPRPSFEQVLVWVLYIVPTTWLFLRPGRTAPASAAATPEQSGADRRVSA